MVDLKLSNRVVPVINNQALASQSEHKRSMLPTINEATVESIAYTWHAGRISGADISKKGNPYVKIATHLLKVEVNTQEFATNRFYVPFAIDESGEMTPLNDNDEVKAFYSGDKTLLSGIRSSLQVSPKDNDGLDPSLQRVATALAINTKSRRVLLKTLLKNHPDLYTSVYSAKGSLSSVEALFGLLNILGLSAKAKNIFRLLPQCIEMSAPDLGASIELDEPMKIWIENEPTEGFGEFRQINNITRFYRHEDKACLVEIEAAADGAKGNLGELFKYRLQQLEPKLANEIAYRAARREEHIHREELDRVTSEKKPLLGDGEVNDDDLPFATVQPEAKSRPKPRVQTLGNDDFDEILN
jgi:hypothetical protein